MAVKYLRPGKVTVTNGVTVSVGTRTATNDAPPGGLYPYRHAAYITDDYRIAVGWPIPVPECDINAKVRVSAEGDAIADRLINEDLDTGAFARWYPTDDSWITDMLSWQASQGYGMTLTTTTENSPTRISYEYRLGKEVFFQEAIRFDADAGDYMQTQMNELGGAAGYTLIMVATLTPGEGETGIWCPGESPDDGWVSVTLQGTSLYAETDQSERKRVLSVANLLEDTAPMMLAFVFGRPEVRIYAASGPSSIVSGAVPSGTNTVPLNTFAYLGRTADGRSTDMSVLDLGLYSTRLTSREVKDEFALLSSIYGGDR